MDIKNNNLPPFIRIKKGEYKNSYHNRFVRQLFYLLRDHHTYTMNIDHQDLPDTNKKLPLIHKNRYYDIACLTKENHLILIEVKFVKNYKKE